MKKFIEFVECFKKINYFDCFYFQKSSDELGINFEISEQCVLVFDLLTSMKLQNYSFSFVDSHTIVIKDNTKYINA